VAHLFWKVDAFLSRTRKYPLYKYLLAALDWAVVSSALLMAFNLREHWFSTSILSVDPSLYAQLAFFVAYGAVSVFIFQYFNLYKVNVFITLVDHTVQALKGLFFTVIGIALLSFFTKAQWVVDSRLAIIFFTLIATLMTVLLRIICFRKLFLWMSKKNILNRNVLIVGAGETGKELAVNLLVHNYVGMTVVGFVDEALPLGKVVFGGAKVIGTIDETSAFQQVHPQAIYLHEAETYFVNKLDTDKKVAFVEPTNTISGGSNELAQFSTNLVVPPDTMSQTPPPAPTPGPAPAPTASEYKVAKGDSLGSIAKKFHVRPHAVR